MASTTNVFCFLVLVSLLVLVHIASSYDPYGRQNSQGGVCHPLADGSPDGDDYTPQTADVKGEMIDDCIALSNEKPPSFPSPVTIAAEMLTEDLGVTFGNKADSFPVQHGGLAYRKKIIHSVGAISKAKWVPVPNSFNYTGLFQSGCNEMYIRLSATQDPIPNGTNVPSSQVAYGIAIKCLRDGKTSSNLFALYSVSEVPSLNFFEHDMSNHVPDIPANAPLKLNFVRNRFLTASAFPRMLGLSDWAGGNISFPRKPNFPFRIIFHPSKDAHAMKTASDPKLFYNQLMKVNVANNILYHVYAVTDPMYDSQVDKAVKIAEIVLPGPYSFQQSEFADKGLFFQHVGFDEDLRYRPEWKAPALKIMQGQHSLNYQYYYPDLPFDN